jgi:trk system potassium uptake protein TrkH
VWLTGICASLYWAAGMSPFDAVTHSFATLATGGFSTHDASFAYFDSRLIELIGIVFMLIGGISFSVHFLAWRTLRPWAYSRSTETRVFLAVVLSLICGIGLVLFFTGSKPSLDEAFRSAAFQVVSVITSTGFTTDGFSSWPLALPIIMIFASMMGGCAGSTAGGIKVVRFVVLSKQGGTLIRSLIHPRAVLPIKVDGRVVPASVIEGVWGFFAIYIAVYALAMVVLMMDGMDHITAFGAVAACLNNLGPGLGGVSANFAAVESGSKLVLSLVMLLGRLEILTILVLLTPDFWRR